MERSLKKLLDKLELTKENGLFLKKDRLKINSRIKNSLKYIDYDAIYAVSIADNDFYYTLPKEMEFAQYKEIQNYINDIAENEHEY